MTAYSSTLNLRMKDLYDKNYYTPQLPMRTFRNPYFLPTSNQLLFDILKKQSTTSATATPPADARRVRRWRSEQARRAMRKSRARR